MNKALVLGICLLFCQGSFAQVALLGPTDVDVAKPLNCVEKESARPVPCPDYLENTWRYGGGAYASFRKSEFEKIEAQFMQLAHDKVRLASGEWADDYFANQLENAFYTWKNTQGDLKRLQQWQAERPNSPVAKLFEAVHWMARASSFRLQRGAYFDFYATLDDWRDSLPMLHAAEKTLDAMSAEAKNFALWHSLKIRVESALRPNENKSKQLIIAASKKFPGYYPIAYAGIDPFPVVARSRAKALANYVDWVGDKLLEKGDTSLYARVFAKLDSSSEVPFESGKKIPDQSRLLFSYEHWLTQWSSSYEVKNQFLHVICRTSHGVRYWQLRRSIGIYIDRGAFRLFDPKNCELKFQASGPQVKT